MSEKIISPGIFVRENDQSFIQKGIEEIGAAIIGPTVKGRALVPTRVTTYSEYVAIYGETFQSGSDFYQYFTSYAARDYFENGGKTLTVIRILSGSYASATSTVNATGAVPCFSLETIAHGSIMNNSGAETSGSLLNGTSDSVRWEIVNSSSTQGTFALSVRRGDDNNNSKIILETWTNLSLDPNSPNYISRVIGDQSLTYNSSDSFVQPTGEYPNQSKYIRVSSVSLKTPNYFDNLGNPKSQYTSSLPIVSSGSFSGGSNGSVSANPKFYNEVTDGATNSQGYTAAAYTNALDLLANQDEYNFNLLILPGIVANNSNLAGAVSKAITLCQTRGDAFYIMDPTGWGSALTTAKTVGESFNNNYAAAYWPWVQIRDISLAKNVWVPASTIMAGVYAFNDNIAAEWFAPAGLNRGGIPSVITAERKLSNDNRDDLYLANINPLASFPANGVVAYGQKTLQKRASSLDRVNVRRLLISLKKYISDMSRYLVFEQNTIATRTRFLNQVNPYLESVVQRQGLYGFRVVMDESNNSADVIDRNQLVGAVYIQPTRTSEFIILDFNIMPTGTSFPE